MARVIGNTEPALRRFWHPVAAAGAASEEPLHVQVLGTHYVVLELDGRLCAFEDSCPHRSFPLSAGAVVGPTLQCRYHGYRFDAAGRCVSIPALPADFVIPRRADLVSPAGVQRHLGWLWIAPEEPLYPLPEIPEVNDNRFGSLLLGPYTWRVGAAQMTDNFLDVSHFPFVHAGTFGIEAAALIPPFNVERDGWTFGYEYHHEFRNGADVSALQGISSWSQHRSIESSYFPPFGTTFRVRYHESGAETVVVSVSQPVDATTSRLFSRFLSTDFDEDTHEQAQTFEEKILFEDQAILEEYREQAMVLDLDQQFHSRADRMTIELRRVLAEILDQKDET